MRDVVTWAAAEAEHAAEVYARGGVLKAWHAEEFAGLATGEDGEDFQRLAEAARDVATSAVVQEEQTVLIRARLPWGRARGRWTCSPQRRSRALRQRLRR